MRSIKKGFYASVFLLICSLFISAPFVSAHEVYVLDHTEIQTGLEAPSIDFSDTIRDHLFQFILWGAFTLLVLLTVYFISTSARLRALLNPYIIKMKRYAPHVAQITLGLALIASGYYHAIFGIELPLTTAFGSLAAFMSYLLMAIGAMMLLGILPRVAGIITAAIFIALIIEDKFYMLNYATYFGEAIAIAIFGGSHTILKLPWLSGAIDRIIHPSHHHYQFFIIRVLFGISLIYASLYAKLIHGDLALEVVNKYHLTNYFAFEPLFLVLGAMIIEVMLGLFFMFGFQIRFASIFFLIFLTMSLVFFGEAVWPHIILIGTALTMFLHGYDRYTVSAFGKKAGELEPVL